MIAPPTAGVVSTFETSAHLVKAANAAAASPHGLVNLIRLVKSLDSSSAEWDEDVSIEDPTAMRINKDLNSITYARTLLEALRKGNEQTSTTSSTLKDLDVTLNTVEKRYSRVSPTTRANGISGRRTPPAAPSSYPQQVLPPAQGSPNMSNLPTGHTGDTQIVLQSQPRSNTAKLRHRKVPNLSEYLAAREREDARGDESGLIPLRLRTIKKEPSSRDQLFDGSIGVAMGASQLHEELGGQLADMSNRLKLNAVHFANSLEEEKALLDTSQQTLENNLSTTRSSKKNLTAVSRKGRGTTCMTLGVVFLVLFIFIWTYMLIRFT